MTPPAADARRSVQRIAAELLDRAGRLEGELERLKSASSPEHGSLTSRLGEVLETIETEVVAHLRQLDNAGFDPESAYHLLGKFATRFYFCHEVLAFFPTAQAPPAMFDVLREATPVSIVVSPTVPPSLVLGTAFNAYEIDFVEMLVTQLPYLEEIRDIVRSDSVFQLAICDTAAPTSWAILGHEIGHHLDRTGDISPRITDEFLDENRGTTRGLPIKDIAEELWADLVGAYYFGGCPVLAVASMEFCMLPLRKNPWNHKVSPHSRVHPPLAWRLRVVAEYLREQGDDASLVESEEKAWTTAFAVHAGYCPTVESIDESEYAAFVVPIVEKLKKHLSTFPKREPIPQDAARRAIKRLENRLPVAAQGLPREILSQAVDDYVQKYASAGDSDRFKRLGACLREVPASVRLMFHAGHAARHRAIDAGATKLTNDDDAAKHLKSDLAHIEQLVDTSLVGAAVHKELLRKMKLPETLPESPEVSGIRRKRSRAPRSGGLMSDLEIMQRLIEEDDAALLFVSPVVDERQLGPASIDVRLGTELVTTQTIDSLAIDLAAGGTSAQRDVIRYFKRQRIRATDAFVLHPGQFALATTLEYLRLPLDIAARLEGRSTPARLGIQVHATAGFVDPGFEGTLTFELSNAGNLPVRIPAGFRLGQLCFFRVRRVQVPYSQKELHKYSRSIGVRLPALYREPELADVN